jgi:hypothetical protein
VLTCQVNVAKSDDPVLLRPVGEIFTSELTVSFVLRLHVFKSGLRPQIAKILSFAGLSGDPANWNDPLEQKLLDGLLAYAVSRSYKSSEIYGFLKKDRNTYAATSKDYLDFGTSRLEDVEPAKGGRAGLHNDFLRIMDWPDVDVFAARGYQLEAAARVPLSRTRYAFKPVFEALKADASLPPQPGDQP